MWSTACPDWEDRIRTGRSLVPDLPLFRGEADRALQIFRKLRIPDIVGRPTMAEACGPWFFPIVEVLFGSYDPELNRRMIQEYFELIPKGNAKSSNGGAVMLTATIMNKRPEAEFDFIAPTIKVATIAFGQAASTIRADPELDKLFQVRSHIRTIENRANGSKLQIKAADTDVVTGGKALGTMIDETHVLAAKPNAPDIFVEIRGALGKRPDGFLFQTTTQSKDPPSGQFKVELDRARAVRDGELQLPLLPILYEYPKAEIEAEAWRERRTWGWVNPNMGRSLDEEFLKNTLAEADRIGAEQLALVASQHFNVEIGGRLRFDHWIGAKYWPDAQEPGLSLPELLDRSEVAVVGIDGGGLDDLLGAYVIGREIETRNWLGWGHAWAQSDVLERRKEIVPVLRDLEAAGELTICPPEDPTLDIREVADLIQTVDDSGRLPEKWSIGFDPQVVAALIEELTSRSLGGERLVAVGQGYRLSRATWGLERKLKDRTFRPAQQRLMVWATGNAKVRQVGNAIVIEKQLAGKAKIDPLMAALDAAECMSRNPQPARKRSYQMMFV